MLLDSALPRWDIADRHAIAVGVSAERTYEAIRHVDFAAAPIARLLIALRNPLVLLGRRRLATPRADGRYPAYFFDRAATSTGA